MSTNRSNLAWIMVCVLAAIAALFSFSGLIAGNILPNVVALIGEVSAFVFATKQYIKGYDK